MKVKGVMRTWLPWQYHLSKEVNSLKIHFTDKSAWKQGENMNFPTKKKEFLIFSSSYLFTTVWHSSCKVIHQMQSALPLPTAILWTNNMLIMSQQKRFIHSTSHKDQTAYEITRIC